MVIPMRIAQILLIPFLMLLSLMALAADIQVSIDRNPVNLNDSFQVVFSANADPDDDPDFSTLQDNFEILNQQRSSNASWVNGHSSRTEQWILTLMAKQAGDQLIPPITFGRDISKPLHITVNSTAATPQNNEDIFLEVSANPETPYVQSQVLYTVQLYRRLQITQARLDEPQLKDAVIEKLGEDSNYTTQIKGVDYWVTERKYAIFPQHSGVFTIAPLGLTADVLTMHKQRFNSFFNQQATETRRVSSKAITLNVQAEPADFKNQPWLSAAALELTESWSDNRLETKVGEPLTRTLRLKAQGATVGQLPELASAAIDGIKTYPDQPQLKEDKQSDGLIASREEKIAFIPAKPGEYHLPAIEITWFNTQTQRSETARLPAVKITALAGSEAVMQPTAAPTSNAPPAADAKLELGQTQHSDNAIHFWQALSACLAIGWLLTLWKFYQRPTPKLAAVATDSSSPAVGHGDVEKRLQRACLDNNAQLVKQLLLQWGKAEYAADSLGSLAGNCKAPLRDEIELLNQHLYAGLPADWEGLPLWQAFSRHQAPPPLKSTGYEGLEPLYKL